MHLLLFFSYGVSLKQWGDYGILSREILIYKKLVEQGIKVSFVTYGGHDDLEYKPLLGDIEIIPFYAYMTKPSSKMLTILQSLLLPFLLREKIRSANILKTNQMRGSWVALLSKLLYRKKLILRCGFEQYKNALEKNFNPLILYLMKLNSIISYRYADLIILSSESVKRFAVERMGADKNKIEILGNYVDTDRFKPVNSVKNQKILYVGRLSEAKNLFSLLDAVSRTPYTLDIVGDGEQKNIIQNYINRKNIKANLLGSIPNSELPEIINSYPVFILSSFYEGNPKALLEAMSCGIPVIGTNVDGIKEIIDDGNNGILCGIDAESIQNAINKIMTDENLKSFLGEKGRKYIEDNYALSYAVDKEYLLYRELMQRDI